MSDKMREALCDAAMQPTLDEIVKATIAHGVEDAPNPKNEMRHKRIVSMVRALFAERWQAAQAEQSVPTANRSEDERFDLLGEIAESGGVGRLPRQSVPGCAHRFMYFGDQPKRRCADCNAIEGAKSVSVLGEVVAHQFYDNGKWHNFIDDRHYQNTVAAGYEVRALVVQPTTSITEAELERLRKEYEQKQALLLDAHCERVSSLQDRIRQLEAERMSEEWQLVPVEPTEYEIRAACRALWESETHPVLTRAGHNTNFDFLPETILLSLRKKVRAVRKAMLTASAQQKKEGE